MIKKIKLTYKINVTINEWIRLQKHLKKSFKQACCDKHCEEVVFSFYYKENLRLCMGEKQ